MTYLDNKKSNGRCPSKQEIELFFNGNVSAPASDRIQKHLENCPSCDLLLIELDDALSNLDDLWSNTTFKESTEAPNVDLSPTGLFGRAGRGKKDQNASVEQFQLAEFDLVRLVGKGGMGIVFEAIEKSTQRRVALKIIDPERLGDSPALDHADVINRFDAEAIAAAKTEHDNICLLYTSPSPRD